MQANGSWLQKPEAETMSMSSRQKTHKVGAGEDSVGLLSEASNTMVMFFTIPGGSWLATIKIVVHGGFTTCMAVILRQDKQYFFQLHRIPP